MAKHHRSHGRRGRRSIIRVGSSKPIVIRSTKIIRPKHRRHHHGGGGGLLSKGHIGIGVGALAAGYIRKQFPNLPELPFIGEMGTIAVAAYFLGGRSQIARDICTAAIAIGAYELGTTGHVVGMDGVEYVAGM